MKPLTTILLIVDRLLVRRDVSLVTLEEEGPLTCAPIILPHDELKTNQNHRYTRLNHLHEYTGLTVTLFTMSVTSLLLLYFFWHFSNTITSSILLNHL
jgi:hypothetical protein